MEDNGTCRGKDAEKIVPATIDVLPSVDNRGDFIPDTMDVPGFLILPLRMSTRILFYIIRHQITVCLNIRLFLMVYAFMNPGICIREM